MYQRHGIAPPSSLLSIFIQRDRCFRGQYVITGEYVNFYAEHVVGYEEGLDALSSIKKYLKALSISRRCFRNWFPANLNYLLFGKIFRKIKPLTVKCRDGSEVGLNPKLYERLLAGFVYGVFSDLRCRDRVVIAGGSGIFKNFWYLRRL